MTTLTLRTSPLWVQVLIAMFLGLAVGLLLAPTGAGLLSDATVPKAAPWIALPGNVFLALIKMVVTPLVFCSIVLGLVSSPDPAFLRRAALRIFPYFIGTTVIAVALGIGLSLLIQPGKYIDVALVQQASDEGPAVDATPQPDTPHLANRIVDLIPSNYVKSVLEQDMLATVVLGMIVGLALASVRPKARKVLVHLLEAIQEVSMTIVGWAMRLAPIAVFALLCTITIRLGFSAISGMAAYIGTVLLGLFLLLTFYVVVVSTVGGLKPARFLSAVREAQLLAFSTSSSAAVMPLSMQIAETKLGVQPAVARFIIPLGATINMDGTALYQVTATVFLAQVYGIHLEFWQLASLALTAVGASIGTPSTPGVGIVILASLLGSVGVPPTGVALIIGVDRILDMSRTAVNVTGDLTACAVMERWIQPRQGTTA